MATESLESRLSQGFSLCLQIAEQQRIVEKVDELMAFCDDLETLLQTQSDTATRFAKAVSTLRTATAIAQQGAAA